MRCPGPALATMRLMSVMQYQYQYQYQYNAISAQIDTRLRSAITQYNSIVWKQIYELYLDTTTTHTYIGDLDMLQIFQIMKDFANVFTV